MGVCAALSGTFEELVSAAEVGVLAQRVVFPLLKPSEPWLTEAKRDRLWDLFHVPVYAILMDARGRIEAFECEVQEGMHVAEGIPPDAGADASLCDCGRPGHRRMPNKPIEPESSAAD